MRSAASPSIGGGVIGTGWALHYLRMGLDVRIFDPVPAVRERAAHGMSQSGWAIMEELGLRAGASTLAAAGRSDARGAVADVEVVQEAAPEVLEIKRRLFAEIDAAAAERRGPANEHLRSEVTEIQTALRPAATNGGGAPVQPTVPRPARRGLRRRADGPRRHLTGRLPSTSTTTSTRSS